MQEHILIVDDELSVRCTVSFVLKEIGYKVSQAENGKEALQLILEKEKQGTPFDLLLTDNHMPQMSGVELIHALKKHSPSLPIIVLTATTDDKLLQHLLLNDLSEIIHKPFAFQDLIQKVGIVLGKQALQKKLQFYSTSETPQKVLFGSRGGAVYDGRK